MLTLMKKMRTTAIWAIIFSGSAQVAISAPVVATPGSLAGYTYFPKESQGGGGSTNSGEEQDSLQRCLWRPSTGDRTVTVNDSFGYGKEIKIYYKIVGGNGGTGVNGGGGGSSAILKNGAVAVVANGGNGGQSAVQKNGVLMAKGGDVLRFVTAGGGGAGYWGGTFSIGGGGGAGYMGGGGGASHNGSNMSAPATAVGIGGGTTPGTGGYGTGMFAGTAGSTITGGVSTFSNGSTVPIGSAPGGPFMVFSDQWGNYYDTRPGMRFPAGVNMGGPMGDNTRTILAGAGGGLGLGGGGAFNIYGKVNSSYTGENLYAQEYQCSWNCYWKYMASNILKYPQHTEAMVLTRAIIWDNSPTSTETPFPGSSLGGQIITMYQAPVCEFLQ